MQKTPDQIFDKFEFRQAEALKQKRNTRRVWIKDILNHGWPMVSCFGLCLSWLAFGYWFSAFNSTGSLDGVFLCFLPTCFFHVGTVTYNLQREIRELKDRIAKLEEGRVGSPD